MQKELENQIKSVEPEVIQWFHYLHEHPELGFEEVGTADFVEKQLKSFLNIEIKRFGKTGVMGILHTNTPGQTVAFRADMDALPIKENADHVICSKNKGVMHACGHDGHTATLLGAAKILSGMTDKLCGEIRFIFQPSEEIQPGGAKSVVENGALDGVDYIFGLHYSIDEEPGFFSIHPGTNFAANYMFDMTLTGKEGHAAFPHLASDTVLAAAELILALHHIVPRSVNPLSSAVISITRVQGGKAYNTLPARVRLGGTIRYLEREYSPVIARRIEEIGYGIASAYECGFSWKLTEGCEALYNEPELTKKVRKILENCYGASKVSDTEPVMGCEDFSEYLKITKGIYYRVGARTTEADGTVYPTHNSGFVLNEKAISYGMGSIINILLEFAKA